MKLIFFRSCYHPYQTEDTRNNVGGTLFYLPSVEIFLFSLKLLLNSMVFLGLLQTENCADSFFLLHKISDRDVFEYLYAGESFSGDKKVIPHQILLTFGEMFLSLDHPGLGTCSAPVAPNPTPQHKN